MKYREFKLKDDITQLQYVVFRTSVQDLKPNAWEEAMDMPVELFYNVLVKSAMEAEWVQDVVEENEYEETTTWEWNTDYLDGLPASKETPLSEWGNAVFSRWMEIRTLDPN